MKENGVPQGFILQPLIFNIRFCDLFLYFRSRNFCGHKLFAKGSNKFFCEHKFSRIFILFIYLFFEKMQIRKEKNIKVMFSVIFSKRKKFAKQAQSFRWKRWKTKKENKLKNLENFLQAWTLQISFSRIFHVINFCGFGQIREIRESFCF